MLKRTAIVVITLLALLFCIYFIGTGFIRRSDVALYDYSLSDDGKTITLSVRTASSIGYIRGCRDVLGHEDYCLYLTFYSTFGGLNSRLGARDTFEFELDEDCQRIYFWNDREQYRWVLYKRDGVWFRKEQ